MPSVLNQYFDKIYCINLDRRPDRWEECVKEFNKHFLEVERVSAVDGNPDPENIKMTATDNRTVKPGMIGCALSHLKVAQHAKANGFQKILVLEDDIEFVENLNEEFEKYIKNVPESWQLLYMGGNHLGGQNVRSINENCVRIFNTYTTHCIGMKAPMFDVIMSRIPNKMTNPVDVIFAEWQRAYEAYCIVPHLAAQRTSFSDIENCMANYEEIVRGKNFHIN